MHRIHARTLCISAILLLLSVYNLSGFNVNLLWLSVLHWLCLWSAIFCTVCFYWLRIQNNMRLVMVVVLDVGASDKPKGVHHMFNKELVDEDIREGGVGTLNFSKVAAEDMVVDAREGGVLSFISSYFFWV